jgi:hypothetical protein
MASSRRVTVRLPDKLIDHLESLAADHRDVGPTIRRLLYEATGLDPEEMPQGFAAMSVRAANALRKRAVKACKAKAKSGSAVLVWLMLASSCLAARGFTKAELDALPKPDPVEMIPEDFFSGHGGKMPKPDRKHPSPRLAAIQQYRMMRAQRRRAWTRAADGPMVDPNVEAAKAQTWRVIAGGLP